MAEWKCTTCDVVVPTCNKTEHINGKRHRRRLTAPTSTSIEMLWMCMECIVAIPIHDKGSHIATHQAAGLDPWTCDTCSLTIAVKDRDSHLSGAKHRALALPPGWWECETCDRAPMRACNKDDHLKSKKHQTSTGAKTKRWYVCTACAKAVLQDQMTVHDASHESGRASDGDDGKSDYEGDDYDLEEEGLSLLRNIDMKKAMRRRGYTMSAKAVLKEEMRGHDESRAMGRRWSRGGCRGGSGERDCTSSDSDGDGESSESGYQVDDDDYESEEKGLSILGDRWEMASNYFHISRLRGYY